MSGVRPGEIRRAPRGILRAALLCASAAAVAGGASAQDAGSLLRGEVSGSRQQGSAEPLALQAEDRRSTCAAPSEAQQQEGIPAPRLRPSSQGATPDREPSGTPTRRLDLRMTAEDDGARQRAGDNATARPTGGGTRGSPQEGDRAGANPPRQRLAGERAERETGTEEEIDTTGTVRVEHDRQRDRAGDRSGVRSGPRRSRAWTTSRRRTLTRRSASASAPS